MSEDWRANTICFAANRFYCLRISYGACVQPSPFMRIGMPADGPRSLMTQARDVGSRLHVAMAEVGLSKASAA